MGMLKRTKYSRLRNDSVASLEDRSQRMLSLKRDCCLDPDFPLLDPGTPTHDGVSTLRGFIPHVADTQFPISERGLRGQTTTDRPVSGTERDLGPSQRFCGRPSSSEPPSTGQTHSALSCVKKPIALHRMGGFSWSGPAPCPQHRGGLWRLKTPAAGDECTAVHYDIKYLGCVEVTKSMRTLDFDTRMRVTREAIGRLRERTSAKTSVKNMKPVCKGPSAILGQIHLQFSGWRIILAVSTDSVSLIAASSLQRIAHHPIQAISFASGGDPDMADYIAYVAKDLYSVRACHILECPPGRAGEVISSIGQAFQGRFHQLLSHAPSLLSANARSAVTLCRRWHLEETNTEQKVEQGGKVSDLPHRYNVTPARAPPAGGRKQPQLSREEGRRGADTQRVSLYENCSTTEGTVAPLAGSVESGVRAETRLQDLIQDEGWFHGRLGRVQAESLLSCGGDFLVRESSSASGQYVLSCMEGGTVHHLLLVDAHGQVRTRDQVFLSVGHLVRFHVENQRPIVAGSSELCLKQPVLQRLTRGHQPLAANKKIPF